jgi:hypothetical protein
MKSSPRSWRFEMAYDGRAPGAVGDEGAGLTSRDLALPELVAVEEVVHDPRAAGLGEELGAEADEPARGKAELETHAPLPVVRPS